MERSSIEDVSALVREAGRIALEEQREKVLIEREFKGDGSVVTEIDRRVEAFLHEEISRSDPEANILTEEKSRFFDPGRSFTFVIDPIDGTDVYSQGMPMWSISVGLLDQALTPVAGVVFAPGLDLLFFADLGKGATINGKRVEPPAARSALSSRSNLMVPSRAHQEVDLGGFPGKIRSVGSAAVHLCFPLLSEVVFGAIETHRTRIWDIVGAHAVVRSAGLEMEYLGGGRIAYADLVHGARLGDAVVCATPERINRLRELVTRTS